MRLILTLAASGGVASGNGAALSFTTNRAGHVELQLRLGPQAVQVFTVRTSYPVEGDSMIPVLAYASAGPVERVLKSGDGQVAQASTRWALGATVGQQEVRADVAALGAFLFQATAEPAT